MSFVQHFGDALNFDVHFHTLALDGIYAIDDQGRFAFRRAAPPSDADVAKLAECVRLRVARLLERRGIGPQSGSDESAGILQNQPLLAELYSASASGLVAVGPCAGTRVAKAGDAVEVEDFLSRMPGAAQLFPASASMQVPAYRPEIGSASSVCAAMQRAPPIATDRLSLLPDGRLLYRLRRRWRDGNTHVIFRSSASMRKSSGALM